MNIPKYNYEQICAELVDLLIDMCFEKEDGLNLYGNKDSWCEIFCRKLLKYGYIEKDKNNNYVFTGVGRTTKGKGKLKDSDIK